MHHCPSSTHHHCQHHHIASTPSTALLASTAASSTSTCTNTENEEPSCNNWYSCCGMLRYLLVSLALLGGALVYMARFNLSVTIVAMVNTTHAQEVNTTSRKCPAALNASSDAQATTSAGEYKWTDQEQGIVLGTYFWGYMITKMIGGRIAELAGPRLTVTVGIGVSGVLTLLVPTMADVSPYALAALRLLMGILHGPFFPAVCSVVSRWAPPGETATMIAVVFSGMSLGEVVSVGLSGMVVQAFGWRWFFWGSGIITLVWVPFWVFYVRNSPRQHPGVSHQELTLLSENQNQPRRKVPWSRMFKSRHIYLLILMEFSCVWNQSIVMTEGPTFLTTQLGLDLKSAGVIGLVLSGSCWVMYLVYGWLSDLVARRERLQTVNIRRLMQGFGLLVTTVGTAGLVLGGCNTPLAAASVIMLGLAIPINVATYVLCPMDIASNYAGTLSGIYGIGNVSGLLSPVFVSYFIGMEDGWTIIFLTNMGQYAVVTLLYWIGVSASEVEWNQYEEIPDDESPSRERQETG